MSLGRTLAEDLTLWLGAERVIHLPQQDVLAFDRKSPDPGVVGAAISRVPSKSTSAENSLPSQVQIFP